MFLPTMLLYGDAPSVYEPTRAIRHARVWRKLSTKYCLSGSISTHIYDIRLHGTIIAESQEKIDLDVW